MKIGIFDSGIGGLSVLHRAKKTLPNVDFVYYSDNAHVPYGEKTPEEIRNFTDKIFHFLLDLNVDAIIIACNTATSAVTKEYRANFPIPIIGMEPAVKKAVDLYENENKRILVAATPITVKGKKLHDLIERVDSKHNVDAVACPKLVRFAERTDFDSPEIDEYLKDTLSEYNLSEYGTLVLGCTHFNYFKKNFSTIFNKNIHFVDGNDGTVKRLCQVLNLKPDTSQCKETEYYFSGKAADSKQLELIKSCLLQLDSVFEIN